MLKALLKIAISFIILSGSKLDDVLVHFTFRKEYGLFLVRLLCNRGVDMIENL